MPHSCMVCGAVYASLAELDGGTCPVCHACKFIYEASQNMASFPDDSLFEADSRERVGRNERTDAVKREKEAKSDDDTVSVRIRRPGSYEINLRQLSESSDRVIGVEKEGVYHLDLLSMVWKKKK